MSFEDIDQTIAGTHLLKNVQHHHITLSAMADQKANIMLASTSILLSFAFSNLDRDHLYWGFLVLSIASLISLVLALLAVSPTFGASSTRKIEHPNALFFGHFANLPVEDYLDEMKIVLSSDAHMYEAQIRDIHDLGVSIKTHKYRWLNLSYRIFLVGIVTASLTMAVETVLT